MGWEPISVGRSEIATKNSPANAADAAATAPKNDSHALGCSPMFTSALDAQDANRICEHDLLGHVGGELQLGELSLPSLDREERPISPEQDLVLEERARVLHQHRRVILGRPSA